MKRLRRLAVLAAAVVVAGLGVAAAATSAAATASIPAQDGLVSTQDQAYLAAAHQANLAEIDAGRVGRQKAASPVVRRLAAEFVADHTRLDRDVLAVSLRLQVSLPELPSATQRTQLAAVAAKSGAAFDSAWLQSELTEHRQTLAAGRTELARGSDTAVRTLAQRSAPVVQSHLTALEQALGGGTPTGVNAGTGGQAARLPAGSVVGGRVLLGVAAAVLLGSAVLFGPRRRRTA